MLCTCDGRLKLLEKTHKDTDSTVESSILEYRADSQRDHHEAQNEESSLVGRVYRDFATSKKRRVGMDATMQQTLIKIPLLLSPHISCGQ